MFINQLEQVSLWPPTTVVLDSYQKHLTHRIIYIAHEPPGKLAGETILLGETNLTVLDTGVLTITFLRFSLILF